ncbi:S26 family signal peptidase [Salinilacihabitans rarus]|uniref:S26 family signal peptidase n=1 Tax=Salinilacihabitans rarus TaxID=2961596 RepID=UPI0020C90007|nr:S26 family signal peptidase [Salinilacihabitans rarus]
MTARTALSRAATALLALVALSLVLGQLLGQPILLGYVATGSMAPAMNAGDGFVAVPSALAGPVEGGDVVVFDAATLHDGGLTTHRVVGETDGGYVTKGDANPVTDQDGGEAAVAEGQIVAVALQANGEVVTIPHLGTAVMAAHEGLEAAADALAAPVGVTAAFEGDDAGAVLIGLGVALLGLGLLFDSGARRETRRTRGRENVLAFRTTLALVLVVLVTFATAAMVVPSGTTEYGLVGAGEPTDDPQVVPPGETGELSRTIDNAGYLPVVTVLEPESDGVAVEPEVLRVGIRDEAAATVTLAAPAEPGEYVRHVGEYRYLAVLPAWLLACLHAIHPFVAIAAVDAVIVGVAAAVVVALFGSSDLRVRRPGGDVPLSIRIARKLRNRR